MNFLFTSDLHGEIRLYEELLSLAFSFSPQVIILGGDILPSFLPMKHYEGLIPSQRTFIDQYLLPFLKRMINDTSTRQVFVIPGNWDLSYPHLFKEPIVGVIDLCHKDYRFPNGYELTGYPFVPPTPFRPKDYEKMDDRESPWPPQKNPSYINSPGHAGQLLPIDPYDYLRRGKTILEDLSLLPEGLSPKRTVYIMHSPPFGTRLDSIQGGKSAGSRAIKWFIQTRQPLLTLHGHIHESPEVSGSFFDHVGITLSVNPGQFVFNKLHAVTFEIEDIERTLTHTCFPKN